MELSPHHLSSSQRPLQRKAACSNTSGCLWFVFSKFYFISWSSESIYNSTLVLAGDQFRFRCQGWFFLPHLRNGNMSGCLLHREMGDTKAPSLSHPLNPQEAPCFFGWNPPIRKGVDLLNVHPMFSWWNPHSGYLKSMKTMFSNQNGDFEIKMGI